MSKRKGLDEDGSELNYWLDLPTGSVPIDEMVGTVRPAKTNKELLYEFFFGKKPLQPDPGTIQELWKIEGRCPKCGELGRIHLSVMICSTHGEYT